ncbi:TIM barrel protein [Dactylosporangium fulvum]|uniref:TIM barrel protein n=1 Tax=Dactylosporangium fulvum TaxID=53359 RepID=A0ABY5W853_9ACTN|nr:TIM barrel protein [Dactylosporangium fulvum]UWP85535.1 TIM barrel protein [Dactylosporangium fulvum]
MRPRYTVNCSLLFTDLPLLARPAAAKAAGFDAVEFWWPFTHAAPGDRELDAFAAAIIDAGVTLTGLNFFAGDMAGGDRGLLSWTGRAAEFRDNIDVAVGLGARLGVEGFNALYGNRINGVAAGEQDALAVENLVLAAAAAARVGARVLLEPISGAERYPLRTLADAHDVLLRAAAAGATRVALLADLYHLAVNGDDVDKAIATHLDRIGHVQIADAPGRGEPGTGALPLTTWIDDLYRAGFAGRVGLEYVPATDDPFGWLPRADRSTA